MADGTCLPRFKRAFIAKLQTNGVANVSYQSPMQPDDLMGDDGSGRSCWFEDTATGQLSITVMGANSLWIDEIWQVPFRVQVLGSDTDADQETVDQAACALLGDVMVSFSDPSFGIVDDDIDFFNAVPVGAQPWYGGVLPSNLRAARFELTIEVKARIQIHGS
jgi:hypothetical protein